MSQESMIDVVIGIYGIAISIIGKLIVAGARQVGRGASRGSNVFRCLTRRHNAPLGDNRHSIVEIIRLLDEIAVRIVVLVMVLFVPSIG